MYFRKDLRFCSSEDIILLFRVFDQHILLYYIFVIYKRNIVLCEYRAYYLTTQLFYYNVLRTRDCDVFSRNNAVVKNICLFINNVKRTSLTSPLRLRDDTNKTRTHIIL